MLIDPARFRGKYRKHATQRPTVGVIALMVGIGTCNYRKGLIFLALLAASVALGAITTERVATWALADFHQACFYTHDPPLRWPVGVPETWEQPPERVTASHARAAERTSADRWVLGRRLSRLFWRSQSCDVINYGWPCRSHFNRNLWYPQIPYPLQLLNWPEPKLETRMCGIKTGTSIWAIENRQWTYSSDERVRFWPGWLVNTLVYSIAWSAILAVSTWTVRATIRNRNRRVSELFDSLVQEVRC